VCNVRGLVCGCVNGALEITPHARVMYLESKRVKTHMRFGQILHVVSRRGRLALVRGEVQLGRLGRITLRVAFGMFGYLLVPTTPAPRVARVGNHACKSVEMKT
jgi:hypothetical protein